MVTYVNARTAIGACGRPAALFSARAASRLLPMLPLTVMLPFAGYVWSDPASHFWGFFIGHTALVMAGLLAIHARPRSPMPVVPRSVAQRDRSEWTDVIRRLEQVIATLSDVPQVASARPGTLH